MEMTARLNWNREMLIAKTGWHKYKAILEDVFCFALYRWVELGEVLHTGEELEQGILTFASFVYETAPQLPSKNFLINLINVKNDNNLFKIQ
jgi:hypothetical protein